MTTAMPSCMPMVLPLLLLLAGIAAAADPPCRLLESETHFHGRFVGARAEPLLTQRDDATVREALPAAGSAPADTALRVHSVAAVPAVLSTGERVSLVATYAVAPLLTADRVRIRETREVRRDDTPLAVIAYECDRPAGSWVSTLPLVVPERATGGVYEVITTVTAPGASGRASTTFVLTADGGDG